MLANVAIGPAYAAGEDAAVGSKAQSAPLSGPALAPGGAAGIKPAQIAGYDPTMLAVFVVGGIVIAGAIALAVTSGHATTTTSTTGTH